MILSLRSASSQEEARHILINHESDTAGGSDANHVGDDAFVEAGGAFVPARGGEKMSQSEHDVVFEADSDDPLG